MSHANLTDLWHTECRDMLLAGKLSGVTFSSLTAFKFDLMINADSMDYEFDLSKELWLTRGRFTGLQRDYLDKAALEEFVSKAASVSAKRPQIAQMQCRMKGQRHVSYKWGNCILAFTFRRLPEPRLSMHSRTTMITRMGGMDLALAWCIARLIAEASEEDLTDYAFTWHLGSMQHSSLQGVPYWCAHGWMGEDGSLYAPPDRDKPVRKDKLQGFPVLNAMVKQMDYFDRLDAQGKVSKLGTRRRVREQRRAWVNGELDRPTVNLSSLHLNHLKETTSG